MPEIIDPQAVRFSNNRIRVAADLLARTYHYAKQVTAEWSAHGGTAMIPNRADPIIDGSAIDGRPPITGIDASNVINRLSEFIVDYEANGNAKRNTILAVAVNTGE